MKTILGKIDYVSFGHGGYQDAQFGISFGFSFDGCGVSDFWGFWDYELIKHSEHCKWTEEERAKKASELLPKISKLLKQAKVRNVQDLKGKPVEITFEGDTLKSWRILEEVL